MHVCTSLSLSAKGPSLCRFLPFVIILTSLFSRVNGDEVLLNRGGFIFERIATNNLNQEFMSFTRQLDSKHLKPLIGNLQGLIQIHADLCTRAQQAANLNSTKDGSNLEDHGLLPDMQYLMTTDSAIFSPKISYQSNTQLICSQYDSRLPEYRNSIKQAIHTLCVREGIYSFPVGIELNPTTKTLQYKGSGQLVPKTLFDSFGLLVNGQPTTISMNEISSDVITLVEGQQLYLANCHTEHPSLKFHSAPPLNKLFQRILCEKPHSFLTSSTNDVASNFLYKWVTHACKRDHPVLEQHTKHAITEITNILNHQFDAKQLLTYAQYFPELLGSAGALTDSNNIDIQLFGKPTDFCNHCKMLKFAQKEKLLPLFQFWIMKIYLLMCLTQLSLHSSNYCKNSSCMRQN